MNTDSIREYVDRYSKPAVVSLDDDVHIFHFDMDGRWQDSPIVLVNKNGNQFRLIDRDGAYDFVKTWNGLEDTLDWQMVPNLRKADPFLSINLASTGPQGRNATFESLCLLPKGSTRGRRKAVWRSIIMDASFDQAAGTFSLHHPTKGGFTGKGKLWESREASDWCRVNLADALVPITGYRKQEPIPERAVAALEENPLWGMF